MDRQAILIKTVAVLALALCILWIPQNATAESADVIEAGADEYADGSFPDHGGCTFFGEDREKYMAVGLGGDFAARRQRASLTSSVTRMISSSRGSAPRNRGDLFGAVRPPVQSGPCTGIDDCIEKKAEAAGVPPAGITTDVEFLRRARLDITGRIPTPNEVTSFMANSDPNKRTQLVDQLLQTPEWADRWAMFFGDLFKNTRLTAQVNRYPNGRDSFHLYLLESMQQNKRYDQMAKEIVSAQGYSDGRTYPARYSSFEHFDSVYNNYADNPVKASAVGYVVGARTTGGPIQDTYDSLAYFTSRDFLGIGQMDCILCHNGAGHLESLSVWGTGALRLEGWQLAAFFSDVPRYQTWRTPGRLLPTNPANGRRVNANYYLIQDLAKGVQQTTRQGDIAGDYVGQTAGGNRPDRLYDELYVQPRYSFTPQALAQRAVNQSLPLRVQFGDHLTADPQFARAIVNYIWKEFFSRGIVEPADQFDISRLDPANPPPEPWGIQPSHPELLELLAKDFAANGFDLKWLMREITTSRAYQRSSFYDGVFNPLNEDLLFDTT